MNMERMKRVNENYQTLRFKAFEEAALELKKRTEYSSLPEGTFETKVGADIDRIIETARGYMIHLQREGKRSMAELDTKSKEYIDAEEHVAATYAEELHSIREILLNHFLLKGVSPETAEKLITALVRRDIKPIP